MWWRFGFPFFPGFGLGFGLGFGFPFWGWRRWWW